MVNLLERGTVTSGFGKRTSPTEGASSDHKGIDIVLNDPNIPSVASGRVGYVGYSSSGGNMVIVEHADGTRATYMHMASPSTLNVGDIVKEGDTIGVQGSTGISTGDHLHFQIEKNGVFLDPKTWFEENDTTGLIESVSNDAKSAALGVVGHVIEFVSVLLILVLAVVLFMKAFDIHIK